MVQNNIKALLTTDTAHVLICGKNLDCNSFWNLCSFLCHCDVPSWGRLLPQTGQTISLGLSITVSLHLRHLTGQTLTRLISSGLRLVIGLLRLRKVSLWWSETVKQWESTVAVPTKDIVFAHRPRDILVSAWALFRIFRRKKGLVFRH